MPMLRCCHIDGKGTQAVIWGQKGANNQLGRVPVLHVQMPDATMDHIGRKPTQDGGDALTATIDARAVDQSRCALTAFATAPHPLNLDGCHLAPINPSPSTIPTLYL